jgi:hypothetical protein
MRFAALVAVVVVDQCLEGNQQGLNVLLSLLLVLVVVEQVSPAVPLRKL